MDRSEITAVPSDVVEAVFEDPGHFLAAARQAEPGWSQAYGGPQGVVQLASALQAHLTEQGHLCAALRTAAIGILRRDHTLAQIGASIGVSPQAVRKLEMKGAEPDAGLQSLRTSGTW